MTKKNETNKIKPLSLKMPQLKPGINTSSNYLHSVGRDAEALGVQEQFTPVESDSVKPNLSVAAVSSAQEEVGASAKKKAATANAKKSSPVKETEKSSDTDIVKRNNMITIPNLTNDEYLDFKTCEALHSGSKKDFYRLIIRQMRAETVSKYSPEVFEMFRKEQERLLKEKIEKQQGK